MSYVALYEDICCVVWRIFVAYYKTFRRCIAALEEERGVYICMNGHVFARDDGRTRYLISINVFIYAIIYLPISHVTYVKYMTYMTYVEYMQ